MVAGLVQFHVRLLLDTVSKPLRRHVHERRPDGTGSNSVAAYAFLGDELVVEGAHEADYGAFRGGIVDKLGVADGHIDRGVEGDGRTGLEVGDCGLLAHL